MLVKPIAIERKLACTIRDEITWTTASASGEDARTGGVDRGALQETVREVIDSH
jgi:hypothetical protein